MIDDKALVEGLRKTQCPNNMGCNPLVRSCQCAIMDEAADRIEAQAAEIERLKYNGIHSCHDQCERPLCVLERENDALKAESERLRNALSWAEKVDPDLVFAIRVHASCGAVK